MIGLEYLLIGIAVILLILIYYVYSKDMASAKQIRRIAMAVEELHKELYLLDKKLSRHIHETPIVQESLYHEDMTHALEAQMHTITKPLTASINETRDALQQYRDEIEDKIRVLEEGMRKLSLPTSVSGMDDARIIALYQQGVDIAAISKELRLSKPEVEFVLKLNKIR